MLQSQQRKVEVGRLLSDVVPPDYMGSTAISALLGVTPAANASANTKGGWSILYDPIPRDLYGLHLSMWNATAARDFLLDVGVGPTGGGSEVAVISNLLWSNTNIGRECSNLVLPLLIRAGQAISVRVQSTTGGSLLPVLGFPLAARTLRRTIRSVETYGAATADSGGTSVDPGGSANTKGSYSTLGTTTKRISQVLIAIGNQNNTVRSVFAWNLDIAYGASDTIVLPNIQLVSATANDLMVPQYIGPLPVEIPAGVDVKARASCDGTDATDRLFDCVVYGFSESN